MFAIYGSILVERLRPDCCALRPSEVPWGYMFAIISGILLGMSVYILGERFHLGHISQSRFILVSCSFLVAPDVERLHLAGAHSLERGVLRLGLWRLRPNRRIVEIPLSKREVGWLASTPERGVV
jgi:hypothetical protein